MTLPNNFMFVHVRSGEEFYAEKVVGGYDVSWEHHDGCGERHYSYDEVEGLVDEGSWIIDNKSFCTDEEIFLQMSPNDDVEDSEEYDDINISFGEVNVFIELEDGTALCEGDGVTILAVVTDDRFVSGFGYVIFSPQHLESATVDAGLITVNECYTEANIPHLEVHNG